MRAACRQAKTQCLRSASACTLNLEAEPPRSAARLTSLGIRRAALASEVILILPRGKSVVEAQLMEGRCVSGDGKPLSPRNVGRGQECDRTMLIPLLDLNNWLAVTRRRPASCQLPRWELAPLVAGSNCGSATTVSPHRPPLVEPDRRHGV